MDKLLKILIIDDEEIIRKLLTDVLEDEGHEVFCAPNGEKALDEIERLSFDLIFSDVHLPKMNGVEILRKMKNFNKDLYVVMMDSFPDLLSEMVQEEGALSCIHKPFNLREVRGITHRIGNLKQRAKIGM